ncbi:ParB/RepB/Spo0J family partition protein [Variovorax sp. SRS16]|uniref:ParB/RepB/Spo0J family partition protein n=1 Tax=Variovorax sp. SRS16 TaxID=282217 RepID=UPI001E51EFAF|nr:ParB/RepB/Spo0J family partition protein [Variovorax sp. SRS16]
MGDRGDALDAPTAAANAGGPIELSLDLIDQDPNQPRKTFDPTTLAELAATITARGVKTPISVRLNPEAEGRYLINHGARRYRASILAGKSTIPGFIDKEYTKADQVIENLQRDALTPREIADFIGAELSKGIKKGDIALSIGVSKSFVSQHVTLLDLPDPIATAFNTGRVNDVTVVNELVKAYQKDAREVSEWLGNDTQEITRGTTRMLREYLDDKTGDGVDGVDGDGGGGSSDKDQSGKYGKSAPKEKDPETIKKAVVQVRHDGRAGRLILTRRAPAEGLAWVKYDDDGHEFAARLAEVQLVALLEG